ncbi:hypothetical protein DRQ11_12635 [candidate division KSB1 bacterium]|nr:MAG: hypothetical protein DRQ11_12635 [candidate division KSB1 bacterium]
MAFTRIGSYEKRLKTLIGLFSFLLFWPEICSGQDFHALFQDAVFTNRQDSQDEYNLVNPVHPV